MAIYQFKQDLAMAYFPDHSKESASKRFAHEIHSNKPPPRRPPSHRQP